MDDFPPPDEDWLPPTRHNFFDFRMPELFVRRQTPPPPKDPAASSSARDPGPPLNSASPGAPTGALSGIQCSAALEQAPESSSFAVEIMSELGLERNEPLMIDVGDNEAGSSSRASRSKLSKRTKLFSFSNRRRSRQDEAFELQIKELRKESIDEEKEIATFHPTVESVEDIILSEAGRMDLTDDLLLKVFSYLNDTSLCRAAIVCRQWRVASSHEDFWKVLNFENRRVTAKQVRNLCQRYPKAVELNLKCKMVDDLLALDAIRSLRNLQTLSLGEGLYGDGFFSALSLECNSLKTLMISDAVLGSGAPQEIQIRHCALVKLHIVRCRVVRVYVRGTVLRELSLSRTGTTSAILHCPALESLDVSACHKLTDSGLRGAATACRQLLHLNISNCSFVSDETLREIAGMCSNLRSLDASYCPNISLEGIRMPALVSMTLCHCEGINTPSMTALSHCFMLEELYLDYCWLLTNVLLELPRLRVVSLSNCRKFADLTLRSPKLTSINVQSSQSLNKIEIVSTSLQKLSLNQQQGLATLSLQCPMLVEVDLTECDSLTSSICEVFSQGGGCPRLSSLILDSCEGLTEVKLCSTSLLSLSLVSCRKVFSLELNCPNIQRLQLDGCDHLSAAVLSPVGLRSLNLGICPHLTTLLIKADEMTSLDLRGCGILQQAAINCPALSSLDASYCSQLGDDCLAATSNACPLIQSLVLAACPSVGAPGLLALRSLASLSYLDLSYTFLTDLSPVYEACPQLQVLKLSACKYLDNDALVALHGGKSLSNLQELDLSYGSLDRTAIEGLLSECLHLKHVSFNGCSNMFDIDWPSIGDSNETPPPATTTTTTSSAATTVEDVNMMECEEMELSPDEQPMEVSVERSLQTLNCVGCPNIKRVFIPGSAGCNQLSSLNLSLSRNLREVRLSCSNLFTLNLSNCMSLMELKLDCPKLVSLCLQASGIGEDELEEAIKDCVMLETLDLRNCPKILHSALMKIRVIRPGIKRLYNSLTV